MARDRATGSEADQAVRENVQAARAVRDAAGKGRTAVKKTASVTASAAERTRDRIGSAETGKPSPEAPKRPRRVRQVMKRVAADAAGKGAATTARAGADALARPETEGEELALENARAAEEAARKGRQAARKGKDAVRRTASAASRAKDRARSRAGSADATEGARRKGFRPWSGPESAPSAASWTPVAEKKAAATVRNPAPTRKTRTLERVERPAASRRSRYRRARANAARATVTRTRAAKRSAEAVAATRRTTALVASIGSALASLAAVPAAVLGGAIVLVVLLAALLCPVLTVMGGASTQGSGLTGNAYTVYLYLHAKGMGDVPIAAILGNMEQESGIDPSSVNSIGAHGLCQWLAGRWSNLQRYADDQGKPWDDIQLQLDFLYTQDEYPGASWRAGFEAETDVDEATRTFMRMYERPGDSTLAARQRYAREYLAKIRSGSFGSTSVPYYCQWDSRWADHPYGNGSTLKTGGCSPTSLAMVVSAATGTTVTPADVADWAGSRYWVDGAGTNNSAMYQAAAKKWNLGTVRRSTSISEAVTALRSGHPVISAQGPGYFTRGGHLIVLAGMSGENILVNDPGTPSNSDRTFTQAEIDAAAGSYYIFEGVTLSSGYGDDANVSDKAKAVCEAARSVPYAGSGMCATWVSRVYARVGIHIAGDAADGSGTGRPQMYENFTYSTDRSQLRPGMIIAARYSPIGHVGIYIGGGQVISNESTGLVTCSVDNWIARFGGNGKNPVRWGYPPGVN